jgi:hypothetical protein
MESEEFRELEQKIKAIKKAIDAVWRDKIGDFKILDEDLVPEGLKPIARSISWLIDQITVQNLRRYKDEFRIEELNYPPHGLTQYDCVIKMKNDNRDYYLNIKTSLTITKLGGRFDISKARRLIQLYRENPNLVLIVAIIRVDLDNIWVRFNNVVVFNVAWIPDIYYNRANHNLQSRCNGSQIFRTNEEFVSELERLMEDAGHLEHYS